MLALNLRLAKHLPILVPSHILIPVSDERHTLQFIDCADSHTMQ